jgi:CubicO group peptidase (beta-lactamase class C family)
VAILQLVQQGRVKLSDTVGTHLTGFAREIAEQVTIHHLLTADSGGWVAYLRLEDPRGHSPITTVRPMPADEHHLRRIVKHVAGTDLWRGYVEPDRIRAGGATAGNQLSLWRLKSGTQRSANGAFTGAATTV